MADNTGAFLGIPTSAVGYRLVFNGTGPQRLNEFFTALGAPVPQPTTNPTQNFYRTDIVRVETNIFERTKIDI